MSTSRSQRFAIEVLGDDVHAFGAAPVAESTVADDEAIIIFLERPACGAIAAFEQLTVSEVMVANREIDGPWNLAQLGIHLAPVFIASVVNDVPCEHTEAWVISPVNVNRHAQGRCGFDQAQGP